MLHVSPELERAPEPPQLSPRRTGVLAWVGPFAVFMAWLAADKLLPIPNPAREILRDVVLVASIFGFSRRLLPTRAPYWLGSTAVGLAVFALWVLPDRLLPGWRSHWLLQNAVTGQLTTSIPPSELSPLLLVLRTMRASLLVPVLEELFWRGWLPRWLQDTHFARVIFFANFNHAFGLFFHAGSESVEFDNQHRAGVKWKSKFIRGFDGLRDHLIHHFQCGGDNPRANDVADGLARVIDTFKNAEHRFVGLRRANQFHHASRERRISAVVESYSEARSVTEEDLHRVITATVPLAVTMEEQIKAIKSWAHDRALNASTAQKM